MARIRAPLLADVMSGDDRMRLTRPNRPERRNAGLNRRLVSPTEQTALATAANVLGKRVKKPSSRVRFYQF
jgi:hypothetical protein